MNLEHAKRVLKHQQEQQDMLISSAFPGKFLKAEDLMGDTTLVTIKAVTVEPVGMSNERLPIVYFKEFQKGLVLNKTNSKTISRAYGDETNFWRGKQVELYEAMVEYQGDVMPALRVRTVQQTQQEEHAHAGMSTAQAAAEPVKPALLGFGETAAREGIDAFRKWRDALSAGELDSVRPFLERLTATAKYADKPQLSDEAKKLKK